jgi:hypothetical protein
VLVRMMTTLVKFGLVSSTELKPSIFSRRSKDGQATAG